MQVLIVEDDSLLREGLSDLLRGAGYEVDTAADGELAVRRGMEGGVDLVLLDLMLPALDGVSVCRRLKMARPGLLVLVLTALGSEDDKVGGLAAGADDYLTKPFGVRELLARIDALERRSRTVAAEAELVDVDGCRLDLGRCEAQRDGRLIPLTAREVGILRWLYRQRARAVTRS